MGVGYKKAYWGGGVWMMKRKVSVKKRGMTMWNGDVWREKNCMGMLGGK